MVAVVVPWRPGCPARERNWRWLRGRYEAEGRRVVEAAAPPGPWSKGAALAPAIAECPADIIVQADADCFTDGLPDAIRAVEAGAPWAIPHDELHRLDERGTAAVIAGADWVDQSAAEAPYKGIEAGGVLIARRETLLELPVDPRFLGWGHDDESHAVALRTLAGDPWRGVAPLVHLFHPPQERMNRRRGSRASWDLRFRYVAARNDPAAMTSLIEEGRLACSTTEQTDHDHPPIGHR